MFAVDAQAADSTVPINWNVSPITNGAYRESFENTNSLTWAMFRTGVSVVTNLTISDSLPARSNAWFGASTKVLQLDTDGSVLTNSIISSDASPVSFASSPVYVDMRVKFDAMTDGPDPALLNDTKLAVFVSSDCRLVAVNANGWTTNATLLDTNKWHQLTIKLTNGTYAVSLDDAVVFPSLALKNSGTANQMDAASFYGTGLIDELYIGHGDPAYAVTGPTTAIPQLPSAGANQPSDVQQTRINAWLSAHPGVTSLASLSQDQLSQAYLLNELADGTPAPVDCSFGVFAFDVVSATSINVTVLLSTTSGAKNGKLNGWIQLQGKVNYADASWTTLDGAITPSYVDFTNGKATYTFTVPAGYKFFKPLIVP